MKNLDNNLSQIKQSLKLSISDDNIDNILESNHVKISSKVSDNSDEKYELMKKINEKTEEINKKD